MAAALNVLLVCVWHPWRDSGLPRWVRFQRLQALRPLDWIRAL
jgi:hypothetical protein